MQKTQQTDLERDPMKSRGYEYLQKSSAFCKMIHLNRVKIRLSGIASSKSVILPGDSENEHGVAVVLFLEKKNRSASY